MKLASTTLLQSSQCWPDCGRAEPAIPRWKPSDCGRAEPAIPRWKPSDCGRAEPAIPRWKPSDCGRAELAIPRWKPSDCGRAELAIPRWKPTSELDLHQSAADAPAMLRAVLNGGSSHSIMSPNFQRWQKLYEEKRLQKRSETQRIEKPVAFL